MSDIDANLPEANTDLAPSLRVRLAFSGGPPDEPCPCGLLPDPHFRGRHGPLVIHGENEYASS
jgi:hypothetical protein